MQCPPLSVVGGLSGHDGQIPAIDRVYPLADYEAALKKIESGEFVG